jgi:hypothetical protein
VNRQPPPGGEAATWKGLVIIAGAVALGLLVTKSFAPGTGTEAASQGPDQNSGRTTSTVASTLPATTATTAPLRDPKEVKVVVANGTSTSGGTKKVIDALKPACYAVQLPVDATAKVKAEKRETTTVYSTPGYEREAAQITTRLGLQTTANAALPPELPIPKTGVPTYNVLVLVGQDLVETPPQPLPPCEGGASTSTSAGSSSGSRSTTTRRSATSTTAKATTTTRPRTTTTKLTTTVT